MNKIKRFFLTKEARLRLENEFSYAVPNYRQTWLARLINHRRELFTKIFMILLIVVITLTYLYPRAVKAALLSLTTSANQITVDIPGRYRAVMNTNDTTDYLTFYDRDEDDASPDPTHEFIGPQIKSAGSGSIQEVTASANTTLDQTSYTQVNSMSVTPGAGSYLAIFTMQVLYNSSPGSNVLRTSIFVNSVQQTESERELGSTVSLTNAIWTTMTHAYITVGAGESVDVRYLISTTPAFTGQDRALTLYPVDPADVTEATATVDTTTSSGSYTQMDSMAIPTPGAGNYLLVFSSSVLRAADGSGPVIDVAVHVNDSISGYEHTERTYRMEGSLDQVAYPVLIAAKVSPTAGQDVEVWWRNSGDTNTITARERTLTLIKVETGELFEANSTITDTDTSSSDEIIDDMTLTPGAGDFLAIYSSTEQLPTITANKDINYSFFVNSSQVTTSERDFMMEESVDGNPVPVYLASIVSPAASQAVDVMWRGSDTTSRDNHERTFVLLKESASSDNQLRYDNSRTTTILENTSTRIRIRVDGCLDTAAGGACLTDGTDNILVREEYTFTPEGMFVTNNTNFRTNGVSLPSSLVDDGYSWLMVEADVTDAGYDDTQSIYYGNGSTESSTSTDGVAFEDSNIYTTLLGHGTGSYQSAQIGILTWLSQTGGTDDWYWDEDVSGEVDRLYTREQGTTPTGTKTMDWYFQLRPKDDLDTEAEREAYINNYRNPDTLSFTTGSSWQEVGSDEWNESEGAYTIAMSGNQATFDIDGGTYTRHSPYYKLRSWSNLKEPLTITLEDRQLRRGTHYNASLKPFTDADFYDNSATTYTQLAAGGDNNNSSEYLNDPDNDSSIIFDANDYFYLGSDDPFTGVNVDLAVVGSGASPNVTWQYCSANSDTATACDTWSSLTVTDQESGANDLTVSGSFYFTQPTWLQATVNSGPSLYYIRGALTSGSFSTNPVENTIRTDIVTLQHLENTTANSQTWKIPGFTASNPQKGSDPIAHWLMDEGNGTTVNDKAVSGGSDIASRHDLTVTNAAWEVSGSGMSSQEIYLRFDGSGDYLKRNFDPDFDFSDRSFTISGWFKHPSEIATNPDYLLAYYGTTGFKLYMKADDTFCFGIDDDATWSAQDEVCTSVDVADSTWHNFSAVKSGTSSITLYIDGNQVGTDASLLANGSLSASSIWYVGIDSDGSSNGWDGFLDNFAVYTYARTADQVKSDFLAIQSGVNFGGKTHDSLTDGLVGYWKMDDSGVDAEGETSTDSSGNGYNGTLYGDNGVGDNGTGMDCTTSGKFGTGCDYDGVDDYVTIADNDAYSLITTGQLTVSFWYKPDVLTENLYLINKRAGSNYEWDFRTGTSGAIRAFILQSDNTIYLEATSGSGVITQGNWHYIVFAANNSSPYLKLYVNGVLVAEDTTSSGSIINGTAAITIAKDGSGSTYVDGQFDEARVYNRALSPAEVSQLYNWAPGLLGYWKMDEGSANTCSGGVNDSCDSSGNGYDGAWNGNTTSTTGKFGSGVTFDGTGDYVDAGDIGL